MLTTFFIPTVSGVICHFFPVIRSDLPFCPKIIFLPLFVAMLKFCLKCKNAFILETMRDRANTTSTFVLENEKNYKLAVYMHSLRTNLYLLKNKCLENVDEFTKTSKETYLL